MRNLFKFFEKKKDPELFCKTWKSEGCPLPSHSTESCTRPICPAGLFALAGIPCGVCVVIKALDMTHETADNLRSMGIREGAQVSLLNSNDPMLLTVENTRIAISRCLALQIQVESIA